MKFIVKNKLALIFAVFGAIFALVLSLISKAGIIDLFIRFFIGAMIMGGIGFVLNLFLEKNLSEEEYKYIIDIIKLPGLDSDIEKVSMKTRQDSTGEKKIDIIDDTSGIGDYNSLYNEETDTGENFSGINRYSGKAGEMSGETGVGKDLPLEGNITVTPLTNKSANRFMDNEDDMEVFNEKKDDLMSDLHKVDVVKREEKLSKVQAGTISPKGDLKIKIGNKNLAVDPKVVAKAIKTVISRD